MSLKENAKSWINCMLSATSFLVIIFIFVQIWRYIYGNGYQSINGYSFSEILWYLIAAEIIGYSNSSKYMTRSISTSIISGQIAYTLNKPYSFFFYHIVNNFGEQLFKAICLLPIGLIFGYLLIGGFPINFEWYTIPLYIVTMLGSYFVSNCLYGMIGLLSFWIEDSTPFTWILSKMFLVFGIFFPPEFFPGALSTIIYYSPVYSILSGPAKLLANFSWTNFGMVVLFQICYIIIFYVISELIFNAGKRRLVVNGG